MQVRQNDEMIRTDLQYEAHSEYIKTGAHRAPKQEWPTEHVVSTVGLSHHS